MRHTLVANAKARGGRGAFNKAIVFGVLERNGNVYTKIVPNV